MPTTKRLGRLTSLNVPLGLMTKTLSFIPALRRKAIQTAEFARKNLYARLLTTKPGAK